MLRFHSTGRIRPLCLFPGDTEYRVPACASGRIRVSADVGLSRARWPGIAARPFQPRRPSDGARDHFQMFRLRIVFGSMAERRIERAAIADTMRPDHRMILAHAEVLIDQQWDLLAG